MLTRLIVVIIWQYIQISNHYAVYLKVICYMSIIPGFPGDSVVKNPRATAGDVRHRLESWLRKIPREGNGSPLQYSCLENPMDRGAWQATVYAITKSWHH